MNSFPKLPIDTLLPELVLTLSEQRTVVLQAPPGSGKTTRVPLSLLDADWLQGRRILMLEPRRLAATNAARYMAAQRQEEVGGTIGFAIRYERKSGPNTRLEVMTEGLLTRRLQNDPALEGVGLVIFDEFHERSLQADLALAICRDVQQGLRDDLRILIMSATLDAEPLARILNDCPIVTASGRTFPVAIEHMLDHDRHQIATATAQGIRHALKNSSGDILVFLPGSAEIRRCSNLLQDLSPGIALRPLFGNLPFAEQEAAILPGKSRRVVLATNIAETSLTIEGIEAVVDSGWERRPHYDAARGMTSLATHRISRASAEQRAGRAGRLGPGRCYRLWSEGTHGTLLPFAPPEIRQADLAPLAFELIQWGVSELTELTWLDLPPEGHLAAAHRLLKELGALDEQGKITATGRKMAHYPTHPRLARLLVAAVDEACPALGSDLVAILSERDLLEGPHRVAQTSGSSDLLERLDLLRTASTTRNGAVRRASDYWRKKTGAKGKAAPDAETVGYLLACAYPDRVALQRKGEKQRYLLSNGQGGMLSQNSVVVNSEWIVAVEIDGHKLGEGEIRLASALSRSTVEMQFGAKLAWHREAGWDDTSKRVFVREVKRLGAILFQERPVAVTPGDTLPALLDLIRRQGLGILPWTNEARQLQARLIFLHRHLAEQGWQNWTDEVLLLTLEKWLSPWLETVKNRHDLMRIDLASAFVAQLNWQRRNELEQLAPTRLEVPSGSKIRIEYGASDRPLLAVKLQEMFGLAETPRVAGDRVAVLIHLLSPSGRPLAVTDDLRSFWDTVYPEVRKEMKGRYPKHPWPDDPWLAVATKKTKKRQADSPGGSR